MFGKWYQRKDCKCKSEELEPTKHACCMRFTQNIFEAAVNETNGDILADPMKFFATTQYNAKMTKNWYMQKKENMMMGKLKDWMKQYKEMKYTKSPFQVAGTLINDF